MRFLTFAAFIALCLSLTGSGKKSEAFLVSFHLQGEEAASPKFTQPIRLGSEGKVYYFEKLPTLTDKDIAWFYPFVAEDGKSFGAAFKMNTAATNSLKAATMKSQGSLLGIRVVDAPLKAVLIDRPIEDGIIVVWDGLGKSHLQAFQKRFPHVEDMQKIQESLNGAR